MLRQLAPILLLAALVTTVAQAETPNVILVMCDDLRYGDPGCFNPQSPIETPNIDAMAAAGLKFTRFYSAAPVCSPTRGSCLLLRPLGYRTGHFGKGISGR